VVANGTFCLFYALILNFVIVHDVNYINKNAALLQPINISGIDEVKDIIKDIYDNSGLISGLRMLVKINLIVKHQFVVCCKEV